jgi:hypothetical protein
LGAHQYDFDIETGVSDLSPRPGEDLDIDALRATVEDAGFELLDLALDVTGNVEAANPEHSTEATLTVPSTGQTFHLVLADTSEGRMTWSTLSENLQDGFRLLTISGPARKGETGSIELEVHKVARAAE